jgi:hypothetical protein
MATKYKLNPTNQELMDEMKNEKVAPPRGTTKQFADTFKEGMRPPTDPDMGSLKEAMRETLPSKPSGKSLKDMMETLPNKPSGKSLKDMMEPVSKAKGGKVKKYADGGMTQQPTYPFYGNQPQAGGQNGGTNQTFNMQPQANAAPNQQPMQQPMQTFKKGGKVSSASSRADGCAIRGKTRA